MARIKLSDLPPDRRISQEEMRKVVGGYDFLSPPLFSGSNSSTNLGMGIKKLATQMEDVRKKSQEYMTQFENFDEKTGDYP
jgi:hypothetical protein